MRAKTPARLSLFLLVPVLSLSGLGSAGPLDPPEDVAVAPVLAAVESGVPDADPAPAAEKPAAEKPAADEPATEKPATDKPAADKPAAEKPAADKPAAKPAMANKPAPKPAADKATAEEAAAAAAAAPAAADVAPRTLYLAIGHGRQPNGRWDPGAENPATGAFEIDSADIIVEAMVEVLEDAPNLELTVESPEEHPNVIGTVAAANAAGVDDCIEVHQDSAVAPPGAFAHWYPGSASAQQLADRLIGAVRKSGVDTRTDWHRPRPGLYLLRKSTCRAVLLEIGRVGDFREKQLRNLGRILAENYLADTAEVRGVSAG